ncbi:hypothetical protein DAPPUDRAFT_318645 [Daphnia pulex]|uniref:NAD kinase 2, mitochondrial n=1 Tax=Daphnia pulex TaxID=6669 RepID=E9GJF7_DAPPU|nr:hypothetical protein DAPPUDRAFT_318645 [Daphnia pulex]|eukprot:EFX80504.1 hypothetical protein DAPPUDRAFT_318645 [Daphnia pulex]
MFLRKIASQGSPTRSLSFIGNLQLHRKLSRNSVGSWSPSEASTFSPKKALVLTKLSRYEFEKLRHKNLDENQLEDALRKRGSDYNMLLYHHTLHKNCEAMVKSILEEKNIETKVVTRFDYNESNINWADVIFTAGGDGTFLLGASKIHDPTKTIIGFNSDPTRSEGYLCLPKKYSNNIKNAINKLLQGKFRWLFRKRIRVTLIGDKIYDVPVELHDQQLNKLENRFLEISEDRDEVHKSEESIKNKRILPVKALNEVFIGEALSARVSYYELAVDGSERTKVKSSGLCVSTGTGSTSWTFNINKLPHQSVSDLMQLIQEETRLPIDYKDQRLIDRITAKFNNNLIFGPEIALMGYTIRDSLSDGTLPVPGERKPRGFAKQLNIRSRCFDASLVIDGGLSYSFNDGTVAILDIVDEDALRTVVLNEP